MKIFVASWFFPPINTSEALCCYKLLRNSSFKYDVFSSLSNNWSYDNKFKSYNDKNIRNFYIKTNNINKWVKESINKFIKLNSKEKYDCIMTRAMPEESVEIGLAIKKKFPKIKWIASFADPIGNNPYMFRAYIDNDSSISKENKIIIKNILRGTNISNINDLEKNNNSYFIKRLCYLRKIELEALKFADLIIGPNEDLLFYINNSWSEKFYVLPHNFDKTFYPKIVNKLNKNKKNFTFIGMTDNFRSLLPLVKAVILIKKNYPNELLKFEMDFIGNITDDVKKIVKKEDLTEIIKIKKPIDYQTSLKVMMESDVLIHIDANFKELQKKGSIFLAGKIADYLGAGRPILAITGENSPAYKVISQCGGYISGYQVKDIYGCLMSILNGKNKYKKTLKSISTYDSAIVAKNFDKKILSLSNKESTFNLNNIIKDVLPNTVKQKILSICIPSYNVEKTISHTIYSLINHKLRNFIELLVIDDGSTDGTRSVALKFQNKYKDIVKVITKKNGGHGSTINRAIKEAKGLYFMVIDGDDYINSNEFEKFIYFVKEHIKDKIDLFVNPYNEYYIDTKEIKLIDENLHSIKKEKIYNFSQLYGKEIYFSMHASTYRTDILKHMGINLTEHSYYVDCEYMLFPIKFVNKIVFCNYLMYFYCKGNDNQSVSTKSYSKNYEQHTNVCKSLLIYLLNNKMSKAHFYYYQRILLFILYTQYTLPLRKNFDYEKGKKINSKFDKYLKETSLSIYKKLNEYKIIKIIRINKFNYKFLINKYVKIKGIKSFVKKLIVNKFTIKLSKSFLFSHGLGLFIRKKLKYRIKRN